MFFFIRFLYVFIGTPTLIIRQGFSVNADNVKIPAGIPSLHLTEYVTIKSSTVDDHKGNSG